jgi:chemotaxis response regulator CheB
MSIDEYNEKMKLINNSVAEIKRIIEAGDEDLITIEEKLGLLKEKVNISNQSDFIKKETVGVQHDLQQKASGLVGHWQEARKQRDARLQEEELEREARRKTKEAE